MLQPTRGEKSNECYIAALAALACVPIGEVRRCADNIVFSLTKGRYTTYYQIMNGRNGRKKMDVWIDTIEKLHDIFDLEPYWAGRMKGAIKDLKGKGILVVTCYRVLESGRCAKRNYGRHALAYEETKDGGYIIVENNADLVYRSVNDLAKQGYVIDTVYYQK